MTTTKWAATSALDQIAPALVALQAAGLFVLEEKSNNQTRSRYADLTAIWIAIQPMLKAYGLAVLQPLGRIRSENGKFVLAIETLVLHSSGQWISSESEILVPTNDKLSVAWWAGSAQTYGRRYALVSLLGIITGEDDDGQALQRTSHRSEPAVVPVSRMLPDVEAEWSVYAGNGWKDYRLPDGMSLGELEVTSMRKLLRDSTANGEHVGPLKGYMWDVLGERLEVLKEPLVAALEARAFAGFVAPNEWDLQEFRDAATCLFTDKQEGAPQP